MESVRLDGEGLAIRVLGTGAAEVPAVQAGAAAAAAMTDAFEVKSLGALSSVHLVQAGPAEVPEIQQLVLRPARFTRACEREPPFWIFWPVRFL